MNPTFELLALHNIKPVTIGGVIVANDEVQKLKLKAYTAYAEDGGTMCECSDSADYVAMIEEHGTALAAWQYHLRIVSAQAETQAAYDADDDSDDIPF